MKARFVERPVNIDDVVKREMDYRPEEYTVIVEKKLTILQYEYFIQLLDVGRGWLVDIGKNTDGVRRVFRVSAPKRQALLIDAQSTNYPVAVALERRG